MKLVAILKNDPCDFPELAHVLREIGFLSSENGQLVLRTNLFGVGSANTSPEGLESVMIEACEFLRAINGVLEIEAARARKITVAEWRYVDTDGVEKRFPPSGPRYVRLLLVSDDQTPARAAYARAAVHDQAARKALRFFEPYGDWFSLYKAYEVVRADVGGDKNIASAGWATQNDLSRFRRTANSYSALGDEARHGGESVPAPQLPMSGHEARNLVRGVVKRWLDERVIPRIACGQIALSEMAAMAPT